MSSRVEGAFDFTGTIRFLGAVALPAGGIRDADVAATAGIAHTKLEHQRVVTYGQNGTAAAATVPIHCVYGATGDVLSVKAGSIAKCTGDSTISVDVKKNGTTILAAPIVLDVGNTARVAEAGTLVASPTLAAGDLLEAVIAVTAGTSNALGTGLWVTVALNEDAS